MLMRAAITFEQQTEATISTLMNSLEAAMILVMGLGVGAVVISILLPIFEASAGFG